MKKLYPILITMFAFVAAASAALAQSHLRVPSNQHVILISEGDDGTCCQAGQCFRFLHFPKRLLPDGKTEPFSIPEGKTLVITDVEWSWINTNNAFANQNQIFRLFLGPSTSDDVVRSIAMTDSNSFGGASIGLTSGFTVAQGTPICGFFGFGSSPFLGNATLGGYLDTK